ncbi:unnamed protein product [Caenorhabditis sp. 36 PRJEB53466]|nr:unnamed protein product [Caenorhabditis sp. 36 PRJEB53466]
MSTWDTDIIAALSCQSSIEDIKKKLAEIDVRDENRWKLKMALALREDRANHVLNIAAMHETWETNVPVVTAIIKCASGYLDVDTMMKKQGLPPVKFVKYSVDNEDASSKTTISISPTYCLLCHSASNGKFCESCMSVCNPKCHKPPEAPNMLTSLTAPTSSVSSRISVSTPFLTDLQLYFVKQHEQSMLLRPIYDRVDGDLSKVSTAELEGIGVAMNAVKNYFKNRKDYIKSIRRYPNHVSRRSTDELVKEPDSRRPPIGDGTKVLEKFPNISEEHQLELKSTIMKRRSLESMDMELFDVNAKIKKDVEVEETVTEEEKELLDILNDIMKDPESQPPSPMPPAPQNSPQFPMPLAHYPMPPVHFLPISLLPTPNPSTFPSPTFGFVTLESQLDYPSPARLSQNEYLRDPSLYSEKYNEWCQYFLWHQATTDLPPMPLDFVMMGIYTHFPHWLAQLHGF